MKQKKHYELILENLYKLETRTYYSNKELHELLGIRRIECSEKFYKVLKNFCYFTVEYTKKNNHITVHNIYEIELIHTNIQKYLYEMREKKVKNYPQLSEISRDYLDRNGVYVATNGREFYVGHTRQGFKKRLQDHLDKYRSGAGTLGSKLLATDPNAKMIWLCIFDDAINRCKAEEIEAKFMKLFRSHYKLEDNLNKVIKDVFGLPNVNNVNIEYLCKIGSMYIDSYEVKDKPDIDKLKSLNAPSFNVGEGIIIPSYWVHETEEGQKCLRDLNLSPLYTFGRNSIVLG